MVRGQNYNCRLGSKARTKPKTHASVCKNCADDQRTIQKQNSYQNKTIIMKRNKLGQFANEKWYDKYDFKKAIILAGVINAIVWSAIFGGHYIYEQETKRIWQDGFEVGHFEGLAEGDANAREDVNNDFYNNLSKNPKVSYLFKKYFPEPEIAKTMRAITLSESKGKQVVTYKLNKDGSWDCGFFQTNTIHRKAGTTKEAFCNEMHDLEKNFAMARKIYDERKRLFGDGFTAWSDYNNGKYLNYIK